MKAATANTDVMPLPSGQLSLKGRALRLQAQREHSLQELRRKLSPHETEPGEVERVLEEFQRRGWINESRVAESLIHRRGPRFGTAKLVQEMQAKGLPQETIASSTESLRATELSRALAVWQRKFGTPATSAQERARHMRFLASRGFSAEVIRRAVTGADDDLID
jgi:regulatory protein